MKTKDFLFQYNALFISLLILIIISICFKKNNLKQQIVIKQLVINQLKYYQYS